MIFWFIYLWSSCLVVLFCLALLFCVFFLIAQIRVYQLKMEKSEYSYEDCTFSSLSKDSHYSNSFGSKYIASYQGLSSELFLQVAVKKAVREGLGTRLLNIYCKLGIISSH